MKIVLQFLVVAASIPVIAMGTIFLMSFLEKRRASSHYYNRMPLLQCIPRRYRLDIGHMDSFDYRTVKMEFSVDDYKEMKKL